MDNRVVYSGASCILLALLCLALPLEWLLSALVAGVFHELCHAAAVRFTGGHISHLHIGISGASMEAEPMEPWKSLICVLAGPAGSLALLLGARQMPRVALCGIIQGMFNLLPMRSLDGGRALECVVRMILSPEKAEKILSVVQYAAVCLVVAAGTFACFGLKLGFFPVFVSLSVLSRVLREKYLAKKTNSEYNRLTIYNEVIL